MVTLSALTQNDLSFYPVRTLAEATKDSVDAKATADYYLDARNLKSRSTVTFTGETRKLEDKHKRFVELFLESHGMAAADVSKVFRSELQFQEGTVLYWMPVRQRTLELMGEMKKGDRLDVYTILAGAVRVDDKTIEPMFIVGGMTK